MKKGIFLFEIFIAFVIYDCVNFLFFPEDMGFMKFQLHPYWLVVLLVSSRYGFFPGLITGIVACCHILLFTFGGIPTRTGIEKLVETGGFALPLSFILAGIFLGTLRQTYIDRERERIASLKDRDESLELLNKRCEAMEKAQKVLEARIVGETKTVKTLYDTAQKLGTLDTDKIYMGCLEILAEHFHVDKTSLYIAQDGYFVLKAQRGWSGAEAVEGKIPEEKSIMNIAFSENRSVTVRDILKQKDSHKYLSQYGQVLAMFPLRNERQEPIGVVNIEQMDFLSYTRPNLQLIELVVDWVGRVLHNKRLYDSVKARVVWDDELGIYSPHHFESVLQDEFKRAKRYDLSLTVSLLKLNQYGFYSETQQRLLSKTLAALLKRCMPNTDMIFRYKFDGTFAVVSPMRKEKELSESFDRVVNGLNEVTSKDKDAKIATLTIGSTEIEPKMAGPSELTKSVLEKLDTGKL